MAATFSADGEVYRGRVVTLGSSGTATVLFIDFGNTEEKAAEELVEVPEHLLEERRPGLVDRVRLEVQGLLGELMNRSRVKEKEEVAQVELAPRQPGPAPPGWRGSSWP